VGTRRDLSPFAPPLRTALTGGKGLRVNSVEGMPRQRSTRAWGAKPNWPEKIATRPAQGLSGRIGAVATSRTGRWACWVAGSLPAAVAQNLDWRRMRGAQPPGT
jgi:hypothetical protein